MSLPSTRCGRLQSRRLYRRASLGAAVGRSLPRGNMSTPRDVREETVPLGGVRAAGLLLPWARPVRFDLVAASDVDVRESVKAIPRRAALNCLLADLAERQRDSLGAGLGPHHITVGVQQTSAAAGAEELNADVIRADHAVAPDADAGNIPRLAHGYAVRLREHSGRDLCLNDREVHAPQAYPRPPSEAYWTKGQCRSCCCGRRARQKSCN